MKTMSKLALAVVCYHSAIYFDAVEPATSVMDTDTYAASGTISEGWHWGVSSSKAGGCRGQETNCEQYDTWGQPWDEWDDPWNGGGWDSDPGAGSGGGGGGTGTGGGTGDSEEDEQERKEQYNQCIQKANGWEVKCNDNALSNFNMATDYCDVLRDNAKNDEDMQDVNDCERDADEEIARAQRNCITDRKEDGEYCKLHFG